MKEKGVLANKTTTPGTPEAWARRVAKAIKDMLGRKPERANEEDFSDTV